MDPDWDDGLLEEVAVTPRPAAATAALSRPRPPPSGDAPLTPGAADRRHPAAEAEAAASTPQARNTSSTSTSASTSTADPNASASASASASAPPPPGPGDGFGLAGGGTGGTWSDLAGGLTAAALPALEHGREAAAGAVQGFFYTTQSRGSGYDGGSGKDGDGDGHGDGHGHGHGHGDEDEGNENGGWSDGDGAGDHADGARFSPSSAGRLYVIYGDYYRDLYRKAGQRRRRSPL